MDNSPALEINAIIDSLPEFAMPNVPARTRKLVLAICKKALEGNGLQAACAMEGITIAQLHALAKTNSEIDSALCNCRELLAHEIFFRLSDSDGNNLSPAHYRTWSENQRFAAAKLNKVSYGEKSAKNDDIEGELVGVLREAIARIPRPESDLCATQSPVIESQAIDIVDESAD